jgi:glycosyltransferase involved in cell wall biosynthesis
MVSSKHNMADCLTSIIIPVYNEKNTVENLIDRVLALEMDKEIIVVDDHSVDGTYEKMLDIRKKTPEIKLIRHDFNFGKGRSIRDGFREATGEIAIIQDADLEYNPAEIPKIIQPIIDGYADVVYGSRFTGYPRRALFFWHSLGNKILTTVSNIFSNLNLTDMETCYKAFKKIVYKNLKLTSNRFEIEPEITAKVARMRLRIYEVPISYHGRSYWEGKKIHWKDGLKALFAIVRHSLFGKISDDVGFQTLELMSSSEAYNRMIYKQIKPYIGSRILEVGSGIGNMTKYLLEQDLVLATDFSESYLHILSNTFLNTPNVRISNLDLGNFDPEKLAEHKIDTVVCLNVLEHIKDDLAVLKKIYSLLPQGGRLILLVPAHKFAFTPLDSNLGHFRRYTKDDLKVLALNSGFKASKLFFFNSLGLLGWLVSGKIFRRKQLSSIQMRFFNILRPILLIERLLKPPFGLSLVAILEREKD